MAFIKHIFSLLSLLVVPAYSQSQIVENYKKQLPLETYRNILQSENELVGKDDLSAGIQYLELGRSILLHSELLSLEYENRAKSIFKKNGADSLVMSTNLSLSFPYINNGRYDEAEKVIKEVIDYAQRRGKHQMNNAAQLRYGYLKYASGDFATALSYNLGCYKYLSTHYDLRQLGDITNRVGLNYIAIGDYETALKYYIKYIQHIDSTDFINKYEASMKENMSLCYIELGHYTMAKEALRSAINLRKKSNSKKFLSRLYLNLARLHKLEKQYDSALKSIDSSFYLGKYYQNNKILAEILLEKADIISFIHPKSSSILPLLLNARSMARASNAPKLTLTSYERLYDFYLEKGRLDLALQYDKEADSLRAKLYSNEVLNSIKNLEKSIEKENSEEKISLLQESNKLKSNLLLSEQKSKSFIFSISVLLMAFIFLLLYTLFQKTKNAALLLDKNHDLKQALSTNKLLVKEIHHRVKNNLQIVSSLLNLQSRFEKDDRILKAINTGKFRVQSMYLLHQNLYQNEDLHRIHIKKYFEDLFSSIVKEYPLNDKTLTTHIHIENIQLDLDTVVPLGLISNELITNAMKYAFITIKNCTLEFSITEQNNKIILLVKDNGIGIPFTVIPKKLQTMGMQLIASFAKKIKASIIISNSSGTEFRLSFIRPIARNRIKQ